MNTKQLAFINKMLGSDFLEKAELYKPGTKTTVDPLEVKAALNIVPKIILSFLISELKPMKLHDVKDIFIPWSESPSNLHVQKHGPDVYSGEITSENKIIYEFKYSSLPSVGLIILSTFELYDIPYEVEPIKMVDESPKPDLEELIAERLRLHGIIKEVVDQRISEREALQELILMRMKPIVQESEEAIKRESIMEKKSKLRQFLEERKTGELDKKENITCPDCKTELYKSGESFVKCCICYGDWHNKEIKFEKKESGVKFKFPKGFEPENIQMLLEAIKNK